ncbi:CatB-related O-acetyltransferase [Xaviernesmea oryzae]|uniref:CatB-related O-acetyltransferase n=1 Tax=Xaviernesmea oryzae TaxID=464029 RepID=UPI0008C8DDDF|nr:CatB-related O-acetyltransferase [Xaviernesmea oryzae]SEK52437.1 Acetyltransferase (isoleucine patch superfamily) [Xaviernesmea oryzae]
MHLDFNERAKHHFAIQGVIVELPYGHYHVNPDTTFEPPVQISTFEPWFLPCEFGAFTYIWARCPFKEVGRYSSIAGDVRSMAPEHPTTWLSNSTFPYYHDFPLWRHHLERQNAAFDFKHFESLAGVYVGNDVWIGAGAYVKGGVTIGDGAIIGTHAVVTKNVPPYAVVVGNPGRIIRTRFPDDVVERLLKIRWWQYDFTQLNGVDFENPIKAMDEIDERAAAGHIKPYEPHRLTMRDLLHSLQF